MSGVLRGSARRILALGAPEGDAARMLEDALAPDGTLILMEGDPARAEEERRRLLSAGLGNRATVIVGEPRRMLYKLSGPFDLIFCATSQRALRDRAAALLAPAGALITAEEVR